MLSPLNSYGIALTKLIGKKKYGIGLLFRQAYTKDIETMVSEVRGGHFHAMIGDEIHFPHTSQITEIIGHPATLSDLHRWMNEKLQNQWQQWKNEIPIFDLYGQAYEYRIPYDSYKDLLEQSESTLTQIRDLILSNQ